ncbi:MAG: ATP-binding protein [Oscillospiraceae bacterium]|nr:ATP-binding protein [Oscillospiraceae bacterium]
MKKRLFVYTSLAIFAGLIALFLITFLLVFTLAVREFILLLSSFFIIGVLCLFFIRRIIIRVLKPLDLIEKKLSTAFNQNHKITKSGYEEIDSIIDQFDALSKTMQSVITDLNDERTKREDFFANASHELKTPLTAIKGFNELTAIKNRDESVQKYVAAIERESVRMMKLIDDMLRLSALENTGDVSGIAENTELIPLTPVIEEIYNTMSTVMNEREITFKLEGGGAVKAEANHIYEIMKNLIENAVRYNKQGGEVSVTISVTMNSTKIVVSDTGIGIPAKDQIRIFERFYRVEKSRSPLGGGTGLGLAIVKHICALYGWKLSLESKLNIGTKIIVEVS